MKQLILQEGMPNFWVDPSETAIEPCSHSSVPRQTVPDPPDRAVYVHLPRKPGLLFQYRSKVFGLVCVCEAARTCLCLPVKNGFTSGLLSCIWANHRAPAQWFVPCRNGGIMKPSHLTEPLRGVLGEFLSLSSSPCAHAMFSTVTSEISLLKSCGRVEGSVLC